MERKFFTHGKDEIATLLQFNGMVFDEMARHVPHSGRELKPMLRHFNRLIKLGYEKCIEDDIAGWREWRRHAMFTASAVYHAGICDLVKMSVKEIEEKGKPLVIDAEKSLDALAKVTLDMFDNGLPLQDATMQVAKMIQDVDNTVKQMIKSGLMTKEQAKKVAFGVILTDDLKDILKGKPDGDGDDAPSSIH